MRFLFGVLLLACGCAWAAEVQPEVKCKSDADGNVRVTVIVPASYMVVADKDKDGKTVAKVLSPAEVKAKALQNAQAFLATALQVMARTPQELTAERDQKKAQIDAAYSAASGLVPKDE